MQQTLPQPLPNKATLAGMNPTDMLTCAKRLREILEQENAMLTRMQIRDTAVFAEEKAKLSHRLEIYQRVMKHEPTFLAQVTPALREQLLDMTDALAFAIEDNLHRTLIARAANQRVLQTLTEAVIEHQRLNTYGRHGQSTTSGSETVSLNLNQKA